MGARRHLGGHCLYVALHGVGIAAGQDEAGAALRADCAEEIDRLGALILCRAPPRPPFRPASGALVFLANPRFILPPQLDGGAGQELGADRFQRGRELFLKSAIASSCCAWCRGRAEILRYPRALTARPTVVSFSAMPNSAKIPCARSFSRQRTTPCTAGIGPRSTSAAKAWRWSALSFGAGPGAVRSISPFGPSALNRITPSRMICRPTPPTLAASPRGPPS